MHVLILGARAPVCLEWARAFRAAGWRVTAADSIAWPLTRFSQAIDRYVRLPEPRRDPAAWIEALLHEVMTCQIDVVLPTCEEAFYLSHGMKRFPDTCRVFTSDFGLMHAVHHKGRFAALTAGWDVTAPETRLLESAADISGLTSTSRDWVFKPAYSRFASRTLIRPEAVALAKVHPTAEYPWVAQRFVSGREFCSFSLLDNGTLRAHACYHPRYRVGRGSGIWFEPADPPQLRDFMTQFGRVTGYTGQVGFDFIEDMHGRFYVLECNPRGTSGVHLFDDQHAALVQALTGASLQELLTATTTPRMVALAMLLFAAPGLWCQGGSAWRAFARDYAAANDVVVCAGDVGPLLAQLPALAEIVWRMLTRRCGLLAATTADIEWDGQALDESVA
jgi:hypothetical protein